MKLMKLKKRKKFIEGFLNTVYNKKNFNNFARNR